MSIPEIVWVMEPPRPLIRVTFSFNLKLISMIKQKMDQITAQQHRFRQRDPVRGNEGNSPRGAPKGYFWGCFRGVLGGSLCSLPECFLMELLGNTHRLLRRLANQMLRQQLNRTPDTARNFSQKHPRG